MDIVKTVLSWITEHWAFVMFLGIQLYIGLSRMPKTRSFAYYVSVVMQLLSFLTHKDAPSTLKAPWTVHTIEDLEEEKKENG